MTDLELMQQALDALKVMRPACFAENTLKTADTAITALRDRLAQPEQELVIDCPRCGHCCPKPNQEPVAWTAREVELIDGMIQVQMDHAERCDHIGNRTMADKQKGWDLERVTLLEKIKASTLPQRQWVGLTDEEIKSLPSWWPSYNDQRVLLVLIRDIQAKLKEKNT